MEVERNYNFQFPNQIQLENPYQHLGRLGTYDCIDYIINDLVTDKYKMQKIADEGRKKALQFHSWEKRADELYYDLISQL